MRNAKRNDVVDCARAGSGKYVVISVFDQGAQTEVLIKSITRHSDINRIYEHHCTLDVKATLERRRQNADIILAKPRRK